MLEAYRRTLGKTMEQARSMDQVVQEAKLPWIETPDQAAVWGVALGLQDEVERVVERSVDDLRSGRVVQGAAWTPLWYGGAAATPAGSMGDVGLSPGLFSASVVPEFGGMMAAISSVGDSPASSGSGSGGFSGGSSGGGGGGAGGGF